MVANGDQLKPLRRGPDRPRRYSCGPRCAGAPPADRQGAAEGGRQGCKVLARSESGLAQDGDVFFQSARGSEGINHPAHARSELCISFDGPGGNQNED